MYVLRPRCHACTHLDGGHGGVEIGKEKDGVSVDDCKKICDADSQCSCVTYQASSQTCWKRTLCVPAQFERDAATAPYTVYVNNNWPPTSGNYSEYDKANCCKCGVLYYIITLRIVLTRVSR